MVKNPARKNVNTGSFSSHKYEAIPSSDDQDLGRDFRYSVDLPDNHHVLLGEHLKQLQKRNKKQLIMTTLIALSCFAFFYLAILYVGPTNGSCDTVEEGYVCDPKITHTWGQYSPYYEVPSQIATTLPKQCQVTFVNMLSRHGARNPTSSKTAKYEALVNRIHSDATSYGDDYAFIEEYNYTLGADDLTFFGQMQMVNSGIKFYKRYETLAKSITPFVRSSGSDRVVESAMNWTQGFHATRLQDSKANSDDGYPYTIVTMSEADGTNNTLSHGLCTDFEDGYDSTISDSAQATWAAIFTPDISARLNKNLPGVNFTTTDTIYFMDLCPFNTVANDLGTISPFCSLITEDEWKAYDYYQSLGKYYGYGWGNPLGATQGVGFTNELIARMTDTAVHDHTSTNSTLDDNPSTFPVGGKTVLYADFSHDSDMTAIFAALGLYNSTAPLLNTTYETVQETKGYSAAWTVAFGARAYFEKMNCVGYNEELVRVVVNDRVLPLETCGGDEFGRCRLSSFVNSLSFAREGGDWDQCFL
ncbi:phosphoglycerate mutase-like protein [Mollisia scopiformis]|uniref:Phytase A n=1 Tax=Mollisia scopiformis TaxID=149040 RepID=A0A132BD35_MOLSC|nr:phosphoglycerate mutase-like protein [Mollisia scopiformis]KUJ10340.1 phosphoglycerate mutase-like protein [Mollisia scopiformis]